MKNRLIKVKLKMPLEINSKYKPQGEGCRYPAPPHDAD